MLCPRSVPTAGSGHRRHWDGRAAASRCRPAALSLVDAPAQRAQDRGIVGADCAVGVLHGNAVSLGARPRRGGPVGARALGVGHQRLCLRVERDPGDPAGDEPGIQRGRPDRDRPVRPRRGDASLMSIFLEFTSSAARRQRSRRMNCYARGFRTRLPIYRGRDHPAIKRTTLYSQVFERGGFS